MFQTVLGIDVASATWKDNGSALIEYDDAALTFRRVVPGVITWPSSPLTPASLAAAVDDFARTNKVRAVALDGPQGWRDPATPSSLPGVGRRCEYACRTQGKTGTYPLTYPKNQFGWIEFSIQLFDELLGRPRLILANLERPCVPDDGYLVLECFPTSTWRTSGLTPLPGKAKKPDLVPFRDALAMAYGLPKFVPTTHDDLQAVVAALTAAAALGGPAVPIPNGVAATTTLGLGVHRRLEGIIWDARPAHSKGSMELSR